MALVEAAMPATIGTSAAAQTKEKMEFSFKNVSFVVGSEKKGLKKILDDVSGKVSSGQVLAILGPSGAGNFYGKRFKNERFMTLSNSITNEIIMLVSYRTRLVYYS
jgi:ABC-type phosphate transport system ATPase subunit